MEDGYGLAGIDDPDVTAKLATLPKPASNDPADLATAGADAVVALATAAGKTLDLTVAPPTDTHADRGRPQRQFDRQRQLQHDRDRPHRRRVRRPAGRAGGSLLVGAPRPEDDAAPDAG